MTTQQPIDQSKAFETAAGTNTSSTADDILDFLFNRKRKK